MVFSYLVLLTLLGVLILLLEEGFYFFCLINFDRFQRRIYIPLPDEEARGYLINMSAEKAGMKLSENEVKELASKTAGYSGSDIAIFINDAIYMPVRESQESTHFKKV